MHLLTDLAILLQILLKKNKGMYLNYIHKCSWQGD